MEAVVLEAAWRVRDSDGGAYDDDVIAECYRLLDRERSRDFDERVAFSDEVKDVLKRLVRKGRLEQRALPSTYYLS